MARKRANGEGSIYERADGRWEGAVSIGSGRRRRFYGRTHTEVRRKLAEVQRALQDGLPLTPERQTVGQYLEAWLDAARPTVRPQTHKRYEEYVRLHAVPALGRVALAKLTPLHLQRLYKERLESGLSPTTVRHLHAVLHRALGQAARWGYVARNIADLVNPPRATRTEMRALSPEQSRAFMRAASEERFEALYVLALTTGMRQGELLALKWPNVDLDAGMIQVKATLHRTRTGFEFLEPKTARSRRQVALTRTAIAALGRHRAVQLEERLRCPYWQDAELVFASVVGTPVDAGNLVKRSFDPLLQKAGLPRIRFHDLRHSAATLLGQGVHPKIVSEMLGHSNVATTLDLYSHVTPTMQQAAVEALDTVLSG